jgi:hypothetical protein
MGKVLTNTEIKMSDDSIASAIGSTLKLLQALYAKMLKGKAFVEEAAEYRKYRNIELDDADDFLKKLEEDKENIKEMVEFLNEKEDLTDSSENKVLSLASALTWRPKSLTITAWLKFPQASIWRHLA